MYTLIPKESGSGMSCQESLNHLQDVCATRMLLWTGCRPWWVIFVSSCYDSVPSGYLVCKVGSFFFSCSWHVSHEKTTVRCQKGETRKDEHKAVCLPSVFAKCTCEEKNFSRRNQIFLVGVLTASNWSRGENKHFFVMTLFHRKAPPLVFTVRYFVQNFATALPKAIHSKQPCFAQVFIGFVFPDMLCWSPRGDAARLVGN